MAYEFCDDSHSYTGFVYRQTNAGNRKWYIGSHMGCAEDNYFGSGVALKRALATQGAESFRRDILRFHCGDRESLYQNEERILIELDAAGDRQSYNMKNKGLGQDPGFLSAFFKGVPKSRDSVRRQRDTLMKSGKVRGINNPRARQVVNLNTHGVRPVCHIVPCVEANLPSASNG